MAGGTIQSKEDIWESIDHLFRQESGKITAVLCRLFGFENQEIVEDIVQDTFYTALKKWSFHSMPDNPSAWLMQVAKNKTINALKRHNRSVPLSEDEFDYPIAERNGKQYGMVDRLFLDHEIRDSQLRALFACCHPSLSIKARIALTLQLLAGFSIAEIASALLMNSEAVKKSLYRSRKQLSAMESPLKVPPKDQAGKRLGPVLVVLYLMFNEGYKRGTGDREIKESLCYEAARLTRLVVENLEDPRGAARALLALFSFDMARFDSRMRPGESMIDLKKQDRSTWNGRMIRLGFNYLEQSRRSETLTRYHLEAGIAAVHVSAESFADTDWNTIVSYYELLMQITDQPMVAINHAIAVSYRHDPGRGLTLLDSLELPDTPYMTYLSRAVRADMYFRNNEYQRAEDEYRKATHLAETKRDRSYMEQKMAECRNRLE